MNTREELEWIELDLKNNDTLIRRNVEEYNRLAEERGALIIRRKDIKKEIESK